MKKDDWRVFFKLAQIPSILVALMCLTHLVVSAFNLHASTLGVYPRRFEGLIGIVFGLFVHADVIHIISNAVPILVLGSALYYGYPSKANFVLMTAQFVTSCLVWLFARPAFHIGASGLVYSLFGFVVCAGLLSKKPQLVVISMAMYLLYGGVLYGVIPQQNTVSWESHAFGLLVGFVLALIIVKLSKSDNLDSTTEVNANHTHMQDVRVSYRYKNEND